MTDILDYISTWSALKWVVLVLIAGFIGQFGRMMAEAITEKIRLRRAGKNPLTHGRQNPEEPKAISPGAVGENGFPVPVQETKNLQAQVPVAEPPPGAASASLLPDKKALKAMAKARKKEAKQKNP